MHGPWATSAPRPARAARLPFDAAWEGHGLIVEIDEDQHRRSVAFWDKHDVLTVSGVARGEQRLIYDRRKRSAARDAGYTVLELAWDRRPTTKPPRSGG
jgi:hypothetical protein